MLIVSGSRWHVEQGFLVHRLVFEDGKDRLGAIEERMPGLLNIRMAIASITCLSASAANCSTTARSGQAASRPSAASSPGSMPRQRAPRAWHRCSGDRAPASRAC